MNEELKNALAAEPENPFLQGHVEALAEENEKPAGVKIEIEWTCSHEAVLRIQGREMKVVLRRGVTSLEWLTPNERENTFAGIVATDLYAKIGDIIQAHAIAEEAIDPAGDTDVTWRQLPEAVAETVEDRMLWSL